MQDWCLYVRGILLVSFAKGYLMTTAVGTAYTEELARAFSIGGGQRLEVQYVNVISGDTGATVTAKSLSRVSAAFVCGGPVTLTAQPTFSGAAVTLAFTDPAASIFLQILMIGK